MRRGDDASQGDIDDGGSERHQIKKKKKRVSWVLTRTGASQGEIAEVRQFKHKRVMKQYCSSSGGDASHEQIGLGSERHLVKCKGLKKKKKRLSRETRGQVDAFQEPMYGWGRLDASQEPMDGCSKPHPLDPAGKRYELMQMIQELNKDFGLKHAKLALEFYEKNQEEDAEFEIVEVINAQEAELHHPNVEYLQVVHVSFIAQPKNAEGSQKYLFGELKRDDFGPDYNATYCSTFEPSYDLEFNHGCVFCSPVLKFHPADGYNIGSVDRSDWRILEWVYV